MVIRDPYVRLREPGPVCFVGWYDVPFTLLNDGTWHSWQVPTDLGELVEARPLTDEERSRIGLANR